MTFYYTPSNVPDQLIPMPRATLLDLALGADFRVDDAEVRKGCYRMAQHRGGSRTVYQNKKQHACLVTLVVHETDNSFSGLAYTDNKINPVIPSDAYLYILHLIDFNAKIFSNDFLIGLILQEITKSTPGTLCPVPYQVLLKTFRFIQTLEKSSEQILAGTRSLPTDKKRFQLACHFLYHQSFRTLFYEIHMTRAMHRLQFTDDTLMEIQQKAGYRHLPSFRKAFKKKFFIIPDYVRRLTYDQGA